MIFQQRSPAGPARLDTQAARLLAVRTALRSLAVREIRHPMNPGPQGREEMDRLCILAFRGMLVS